MIAIIKIPKYLFISGLLILFNACSPKIIKNIPWQSVPVNIDGSASEWETMKYFCTKNKLTYTVSNDSNNLYVCITTADRTTELKIMRAGMKLAIDTSGKNKSQLVIAYPMPQNNIDRNSEQRKRGTNDHGSAINYAMMKKKPALEQRNMNLTGFKHTINGISPTKNKNGINVSIEIDSTEVLTYEASIPLRTFYKSMLEPNDTNRIFGFTININALQFSQNAEGDRGGRGGMSRGGQGGGRQGGGGRRGGSGGGGADRSALTEAYSCEMLFHLSLPKKNNPKS